ncbi:hypothetical protein AYO49_02665 [Verrucomicrobiaceae bacterium SCGC AG-212-N21]|nr:hypothetical protein AYO49_02665 [Verrucomicrobiaceae bacterium SCGC AG-212-N21]
MKTSTTPAALAVALSFAATGLRLAAQEDLTTGVKPEPVQMLRNPALPPAMVRWVVPSSSRSADAVDRIEWHPNGKRMFANVSTGGIQCWKPSATGDSLELEGYLSSGGRVQSPDGRWMLASHSAPGGFPWAWGLHRADTLEGLWTLRPPKMAVSSSAIAFSPDGRWLIVLHEDEGDHVFSILDAEKGMRVRTIRPPASAQDRWDVKGSFACGTDAIWLAPSFDAQGRITRIPLATGTAEFVSEPIESDAPHMVLSKDERWLVCWDEPGYEVLERDGPRFTARFKGDAKTKPGWTSGLQSVKISPDSTQLAISGNGMHKIIRMANQAVLHESSAECMCGDFSPDGKRFWKSCSPFRAVNTASWQTLPDAVPGHHSEVHSIRFSPDGKRFASGSSEALYVWDIGDLTRPQELVAAEPAGCLTALAWNENGTEVWAGDSYRSLSWKIPARLSSKPLAGEDLFPSLPKRSDVLHCQFIEPVAPDGWCLMNGGATGTEQALLRRPDKPGVVRNLTKVSLMEFLTRPHVQSKDRTEVFYTTGSQVTAVKLADETVRRGDPGMYGDVVGTGGQPEQVVVMEQSFVKLVDAATLKTVAEIPVPAGIRYSIPGGGSKPAVSPDGQWLFCGVSPAANLADVRPALVNLKERKLVSVLGRLETGIHVAAFSPDSRMIAAGHQGGAVSLWHVANLAAAGGTITPTEADLKFAANSMTVRVTAMPNGIVVKEIPGANANTTNGTITNSGTRASVSVRSPTPSSASQAGIWEESRAMEPASFPLNDSETWVVSTAGSVTNAASEFNAGRLLINDEPITPKAVMLRRSPDKKTTSMYEVEALAMKGNVRIHRLIRGFFGGSLRWTDTVENLGQEPVSFTLAFESALGGDAKDLILRNHRTPTVQAGGVLDVTSPETVLAVKRSRPGGERIAALCFASTSPPEYPVLKWNDATRSVRCEWTVRLEPLQRRTLLNLAQEKHVAPETNPMNGLPTLAWPDLEDINILARLPFLLNYAPEEIDRGWVLQLGSKLKVDTQGYKKDGLGFRWRDCPTWGEGMTAELGAERVLELWLNDSPATFQNRPRTPTNDGRYYVSSGLTCLSATGPVHVTRRKVWSEPEGVMHMHDLVLNPTREPVKVRLEIGVVASGKFTGLLAADGRPLDLTQPVPVQQCEGKIAIVSEGADQPAILVGVGDGAAGTPPATVRWQKGRGVFVRYDLELQRGQQVALLHFAAQRPLGAYESVAAGIAQLDVAKCLELSSKQPQARPLNWSNAPMLNPK